MMVCLSHIHSFNKHFINPCVMHCAKKNEGILQTIIGIGDNTYAYNIPSSILSPGI
jgi:hypothetical protein